MAKQSLSDINIEEILLREVAERRSPSGSVLHPPSSEGAEHAKAAAQGARSAGYEALFLRENPVRNRSVIYVGAATKRRLGDVVGRLCGGRVSVTAFVENILTHHLELFREQINELHRERNNHDIL